MQSYWLDVSGPLVQWYHRCMSFIGPRLDVQDLGHERLKSLLYCNHSIDINADLPNYEMFSQKLYELRGAEDGTSMDEAQTQRLWLSLGHVLPYRLPKSFDNERVLCCTSGELGGFVGWVPPQALPGDHICLFAGAPFPCVLREDSEGHLRELGDAFIHDLQEWQALGLERDEAWLQASSPEIENAHCAASVQRSAWPATTNVGEQQKKDWLDDIERAFKIEGIPWLPVSEAWNAWKEKNMPWIRLQ